MKDLNELNKYRQTLSEIKAYGPGHDRSLAGMFIIPIKGYRQGMKVIASSGKIPASQGWDHVSASLPNRCPTWDEMCMIKDLFFYEHEVCMQLHPAKSDNVSNHKFCLHIWRNIYHDIPLPPSSMVGVKSMGEIENGSISIEEVRRIQDTIIMNGISK